MTFLLVAHCLNQLRHCVGQSALQSGHVKKDITLTCSSVASRVSLMGWLCLEITSSSFGTYTSLKLLNPNGNFTYQWEDRMKGSGVSRV
jgi:hypothetical protein